MRSLDIEKPTIAFDGHRDLTMKIQGVPKLRARLQQALPARCLTADSIRIARTREGMARRGTDPL